MSLEADEKNLLLGLADVLIPSVDGRLSATEARVDEWVDEVVRIRSDLAGPLTRILRQARDKDPVEVIEQLRQKKRKLFRVLTETVAAAYFMAPAVKESIGFHGQRAYPIDTTTPAVDPLLLQPVVHRGAIYRPTPSAEEP